MKKFFFSLVICLLSLEVLGVGSPFSVEVLEEKLVLKAGEVQTLSLFVRVPEKHYIYEDKTELEFVSLEGLRIPEILYPKPHKKQDPGMERHGIQGELAARPGPAPFDQ